MPARFVPKRHLYGRHSKRGSTSLPTAPWRSAPCRPPLISRKKDRRPVRPYVSGVAAISYFAGAPRSLPDRKSTRLNSSHVEISYAVFCLKKKKRKPPDPRSVTEPHGAS